ncbi:MAG: hypothetical protein PVG60_08525 [Desulfarculaceae bacterium]|jgi:hypothetical protein
MAEPQQTSVQIEVAMCSFNDGDCYHVFREGDGYHLAEFSSHDDAREWCKQKDFHVAWDEKEDPLEARS